MNEPFDLEAVYDAEIFPLMDQILDICKKHKMPMLASFVYKCNEEGEDKVTSFLSHEGRDINSLLMARKELFREAKTFGFTITTER